MGILQIHTDNAGQVYVNPRRVKIISSDTLSTVATAGYLNQASLEGYSIYNTDIIDMWYGAVGNNFSVSSPGTYAEFIPSISNGVITLSQVVSGGNVLLPVVSGDVAQFNGTTGQIKDSNILVSNLMKINSVNTMAAASEIILDKGTGTESAGAVTINHQSGVITSSSLTTAGGSSYLITLTNSFIAATSVCLISVIGGTNTTQNISIVAVPSAGSLAITIYNNTAATALNGTLILNFAIF